MVKNIGKSMRRLWSRYLQNIVTAIRSGEFEYEEKEFTIDELNYWNQYGISLNILQEYGVISVLKVKEVANSIFLDAS